MKASKIEVMYGLGLIAFVIFTIIFPVFTLITVSFFVIYTFIFGLTALFLLFVGISELIKTVIDCVKSSFIYFSNMVKK